MPTKEKKLVITILQCKRVAAPYFFINYVYPKWKEILKDNVELVLIQHKSNIQKGQFGETNKLPDDRIQLVEDWTKKGRFSHADIVEFDIIHNNYSTIPGYYMMTQAAINRGADLHLWLEDDAIVFDPNPKNWDHILGTREIGVWGNYAQLNIAHLLTRSTYDRRIFEGLKNYQRWDSKHLLKRNIEPWLRSKKKTSRAYLPPEYCVRSHIRNYPNCGLRYLADVVRNLAPDEAEILDIDYGVGASKLEPFSKSEIEEQRKKMNRRTPSDVFFSFYNKYLEQRIERSYVK